MALRMYPVSEMSWHAADVQPAYQVPSFEALWGNSITADWAFGSKTATYTRATTAYQTDFEGKLNLALSGEVVEQGERREQNLLKTTSEDFSNAVWITDTGGTGTCTKTPNFGVAPDGTTTAVRVVATRGSGFGLLSNTSGDYTAAGAHTQVVSAWLKSNTGANQTITLSSRSGLSATNLVTITTEWQRFAVTRAHSNAGVGIYVGVYTSGDASVDFLLWHPMDQVVAAVVSAQGYQNPTNKNPSEYVSVGVLSAPFHGANVDGVKYFSTLNGNTVASNVVTEATGAAINSSTSKFAVLPGVTNSNFSTTDTAATSVTGDIDLRALVYAVDWTPAVATVFISKSDTAAVREYDWLNLGTGWRFNANGHDYNSTADSGFADGTTHWARVTRVAATGAVNFYTGVEFAGVVTWTQLGATVTSSAGAITDGNNVVRIGDIGSLVLPALGRTYRAQMFKTIGSATSTSVEDATASFDFNPNLSTSAQTFTADTGEVWTTNGNAGIFGNTHATYGIPALWDAGGPLGYLAEGARTNDILQSNTLGTTWTISNAADMNAVAANAYVSVDGTTTMDKLQPKATTAVHSLDQAFMFTAAKYTTAVDLRYVPATPQRWAALILNDGTTTWGASFDLLNGVVGAVSAGATSGIEATAQANVYRVWVTNTANAAAAAGTVKISLNATDTATLESAARAGTETLGAGMVQHEVGTFKSSRITTTTVAVARNASVDQYVSAGNIPASNNDVVIYGESAFNPVPTAASYFLWASYVDADNYTAVLWDGTNLIARKRIAAANHDAIIAFTPTAGTAFKWAARFTSTIGTDIFLNGTKGTNDATNTACQIGANFQWGADGNGANQPFATIRNGRIEPEPLRNEHLERLTA